MLLNSISPTELEVYYQQVSPGQPFSWRSFVFRFIISFLHSGEYKILYWATLSDESGVDHVIWTFGIEIYLFTRTHLISTNAAMSFMEFYSGFLLSLWSQAFLYCNRNTMYLVLVTCQDKFLFLYMLLLLLKSHFFPILIGCFLQPLSC